MFYLDTSVLISAIVTEGSASEMIWSWLEANGEAELFVSDWVVAESSSALSIKVRTGQLSDVDRASAANMFSRLCQDSLDFIPVQSRHFTAAANLCADAANGLRAADALHLALASDIGTIVTRDRQLAKAGRSAGVEAILL